ncbi:MAG: DUF420 domain-containing protein [Gammaproteobacteria bacterium]|nr:DUF420 domain-containing protein [Gammaproteobacteria bacterium]
MVSFVIIVPILAFSWLQARRGAYRLHKRVQITLLIVLGSAVGLFEYHLRTLGGIFAATAASAYAGTTTLNFWIWFHTVCAIATTVLWLTLALVSLRRFPKPPAPNDFSRRHRPWGRAGMILMALTGLTSIPVYLYGFAA